MKLSFAIQKLWDLLSHEYEQFQGVEDQVTDLKRDLSLLKSFLKDADAKKHTSTTVRNCVEEVKEIVYDAEDIVETFLLKDEHRKRNGVYNCIRRLACIFPERRKFALEVGCISKTISKVINDMESFGVQKIIVDGGSIAQAQPIHDREREMRHTFSRDYESDLVGLEENIKKLVGVLVEEDHVQVVSITGMGGLGKTTLARQVFNHDMVKNKFDGLAWVCVSQEFTRKSVWQSILRTLKPSEVEKKIIEMTEETLQGWTVLLTSRNEGVAGHGDTTYHKVKPECLTIQDSWILFRRIAFPRKDASEFKVDEEMEELGMQMINYCGRLPLAVKVLGEPPVAQLWAAEGIPYHDEEDIRDVADSYIEELVRRNMVISERDIKTLRYETCRLHDMMREICLSKAKEENFLQIAGIRSPTTNSQSPYASRRFVSRNPTTLDVEREMTNPKLRSLLIVCDREVRWKLLGLRLTRLQLLRVLDLSGGEFKGRKLPSGIGELIHLRYLSLESVRASHLPASLENLKLLMYLNIDLIGFVFVPNVLMGMQELRYLALPRYMYNTKLELRKLAKLETLKNFSAPECSFSDLTGMAKLGSLHIILEDETSIETLSTSIAGLRRLENLQIDSSGNTKKEEFVLDCIHLKHLDLSIYMPRLPNEQHLPSHLTHISLRECCLQDDPMPILEKLLHLKEVNLRDRSFCGKRMVCSRGGFPRLEKLILDELEEWEEWIIEEGSMPLLGSLEIIYCHQLRDLPDGLRFTSSLKYFCLDHMMDDEWEERTAEGGKDYYKIKHIPCFTLGKILDYI
ncbi:unnamed protein product [Microthlaspi erraticum]|uniref:NB-ARC domain-containing protein n=1 Tax=Microthlaspi erraticum TaxID=1685480 RepID=A0A6D2J155_9BRAS|nr:unnamed protein product [Microthlaspi erraticum]